MEGSTQALDIAILLAAALVGGMIAHRLRQPVILGYLGVGVGVGPYALGLVSDVPLVESMATIGVALLMFTLGLEISITQLKEVGKAGYWGGIAQIGITCILGFAAGKLIFDWPSSQSLLFGLIISLSSTMVCLKMLMDRGELDSVHGRIMLAFLVLQDIAAVLMVVVIPLLNGEANDVLSALGLAVGKAALFIGITVVSGLWVLPWLLGRVGGVRSRELFLLSIMVLCLGAVLGTYIFGLSVAFGAFIIGLTLHESNIGSRALTEITPLRDIFAALFFVSLGMLLDPSFVVENWGLVTQAVALVILIKFAVVLGVVRFFGYGWRVTFLTSAGLFQIGEFGFILAQSGLDMEVISHEFYSLILASALITMMLTPVGTTLAGWLYSKFSRFSNDWDSLDDANLAVLPADRGERIAILAGYGRVGKHIAKGLEDADISYTVIEIDPEVVSRLRHDGIQVIYGDASNSLVLDRANLERAGAIVVTFPDPMAVVATVKAALDINPNIEVVARVHRGREAALLRELGVKELVSPEFESSFRILKRCLNIFGVESPARKQVLARMRQEEDGAIFGGSGEDPN